MTTKTKDTTTRYVRAAPLGDETGLPPLENGDRLTRWEFERRYEAMPWLKKAELIEGVVYMGSPVRQRSHGRPHGMIIGWLAAYVAATPGVDLGDNSTIRLDVDNEPQPDALLRIEPEAGGHSRVGEDDYIEGPPELIFEVAASSASYDLHDKLNTYRRNGVQEYAVWQVYDRHVDWWELNEGQYQSIDPDENGVVWSNIFPGLGLAVPALLEGKLAAVLEALRKGLETDEHAAFVARLAGEGAET
jgi:Uma2 family endonuclease